MGIRNRRLETQCIAGDSNLEQITERQLLALAESFGGEHQCDKDSIE